MTTSDETDTTTVRANERRDDLDTTTAVATTTSRRSTLRLLGGALGGLLVQSPVTGATIQQPHRDEGEEIPPDGLEKLVQFVHPEKVYDFLPGLDDELLAELYGLDGATYRATKQQFEANAREAAQQLLSNTAFARRVDRLPIRPDETVIGIGESRTDDLQSWLEIFRHLLELQRPNDRVSVINEGIEGTTTTGALGRFVPSVIARQPDWIICSLGAADAVRHGEQSRKTAVGLDETVQNMMAMRHLTATQTDARWVWITPHAVNERLASEFPPFQQIQFTIRNEDLQSIGDVFRSRPSPVADARLIRQSDFVVDTLPLFGRSAPPALVLSDGIHTSLNGQRAIAKALVESLTARKCTAATDRDTK